MASCQLPTSSPSCKRDQRCAPVAADDDKQDDSDKEPPFVITESKSTIPYWCQRARLEDASEGWEHKRERNELERLKDKPETTKAQRSRAMGHLKTWQHCRNLNEDILNNLQREEELVVADKTAASEAGM